MEKFPINQFENKEQPEFCFERPMIQEFNIESREDIDNFLTIIENKIHLNELSYILEHQSPIVVVKSTIDILPNEFIKHKGSSICFSAFNWHRDSGYPILGIYKPKGVTRGAPTEFVLTSNKDANPDEDFQSLVPDDSIIGVDYTDKDLSQIVLFENCSWRDKFLIHRKSQLNNDNFDDFGDLYSLQTAIKYPMWSMYRSN